MPRQARKKAKSGEKDRGRFSVLTKRWYSAIQRQRTVPCLPWGHLLINYHQQPIYIGQNIGMSFGKRLLKLWNKGDTMDIYAVLGELLYIISNYEKGRIRTRGFWTKKYTVSLNESLYCMSIILQLMRTPTNISQSKLLSIKEFCKKNEFVIFPRGDLTRLDDIVNVLQIDNLSDEDDSIICKMNSIVNECIILLKKKSKGYKDRLSCLIKAFHNLPRVFLDCSKQTVYNINAKSIQAQDALLYASSYIDLDML